MKRKYNNTKVCIDGILFDSKGESKRFIELKNLENLGVISNLKLQPRFILQKAFKDKSGGVRAITYIADFMYIENGKIIVEDFKGFFTEVSKMKIKMLKFIFANDENYSDYEFRLIKA